MIPVSINDLSKKYKGAAALKNISFEMNPGEIFGLIGPDGAGKTTLFRILTTVLKPDTGKAEVFGLDCVKDYKEIRRILGYMPGKFSLYLDMTIEENLNFFASIFGTTVEENYPLIKDIYEQIEPFKDRRAGNLSGGMKQKLALSCALIHKPKLLILDEPTTGVDAVSRREFWEMLAKLKRMGIAIIVATPYMDEAALCDRIALMQNGDILDINTPEGIISNFRKTLFAVKSNDFYNLSRKLKIFKNTNSVYPFGEFLHYTDIREQISHDSLRNDFIDMGFSDIIVSEIKPGIEDSFMALMAGVDNE